MTGPGHVFVLHGSLTALVCDLALIPTASDMYVEAYWERYCPRVPGGPTEEEVAAARRSLATGSRVGDLVPATRERPAFRYVDVGLGRGRRMEGAYREAAVQWLDDGVGLALTQVTEDVREGRLRATRERPLVAIPALGTGEGGFDAVRGEVTRNLLRRCQDAVSAGGFDVALVCLHRSDFAYVQSQRDGDPQGLLSTQRQDRARTLGQVAAAGRLSLFLGAGVSAAAGVPGFTTLVQRASAALGRAEQPQNAAEAADAAGRLLAHVGEETFRRSIGDALGVTGTSLLHGLLASTRTPTVMTTNFDDLFERSAGVTYGARPDVLPWERERRTPWLLKMHGSIGRQGRFVITSEDLRSFNTSERPLASVVQAQMLLNDVLFVGYSLRDPNVQELAKEVRELLRRLGHSTQTVATILAVEPLKPLINELDDALDVVDLSESGTAELPEAARRLEVFCDLVLWHATKDEPAWQLDERYAVIGEDASLREQLRALNVPDDQTWARLREVLRSYGLDRR